MVQEGRKEGRQEGVVKSAGGSSITSAGRHAGCRSVGIPDFPGDSELSGNDVNAFHRWLHVNRLSERVKESNLKSAPTRVERLKGERASVQLRRGRATARPIARLFVFLNKRTRSSTLRVPILRCHRDAVKQ